MRTIFSDFFLRFVPLRSLPRARLSRHDSAVQLFNVIPRRLSFLSSFFFRSLKRVSASYLSVFRFVSLW